VAGFHARAGASVNALGVYIAWKIFAPHVCCSF
jgi:hypothetical protein